MTASGVPVRILILAALTAVALAFGCKDDETEPESSAAAGTAGTGGLVCGGQANMAPAGGANDPGLPRDGGAGEGAAPFDCDLVNCRGLSIATCSDSGCCRLVPMGDTAGCQFKSCSEFSAEQCPDSLCDLIETCAGTMACTGNIPSGCGPHGAAGWDSCCAGLEARCGAVLPGGGCDLSAASPMCLPCGDGVCQKLENHCNCPEDCPNPCAE